MTQSCALVWCFVRSAIRSRSMSPNPSDNADAAAGPHYRGRAHPRAGFLPSKRRIAVRHQGNAAEPALREFPRAKSDTFATLSEDGQRVSVSIFPMNAGNVSGHLLILHDLNYIDQREREARAYRSSHLWPSRAASDC